ncbi:MAG: SDR family oxidoreductase [Reichenbachiella sp.]|uniref:SDR family oxidoreductase n=1 Tax=Reichenbachiella sp. TaxID=2184521 RepID=UPI00329687B7
MKILLTGATGYIGKRLLLELVRAGHEIVCCVRDANRFNPPISIAHKIEVLEIDFSNIPADEKLPDGLDGAYYLMHSMSSSIDYEELELNIARNFRHLLFRSDIKHVVYLSGIINENSLSKHLSSRKAVEEELSKGAYHLTTLRAGIIIGSGSASFEIIRDLVEKLPVMITPKWLNTKCQPIAIKDVVDVLSSTILNTELYDQNFDIGGPDVLSYKQMLLEYARIRRLKRSIYTVPVMTPRLSSYWLYFVTSTSYKLATALVSSMKVEVVCRDNRLMNLLQIRPKSYHEALQKTFMKIEDHEIISSWKDALGSGSFTHNLSDFMKVPTFGCLKDERSLRVRDQQVSLGKIWRIGGENGWYYVSWLWKLRGFIDKIFGGVGLRRGRTHPSKLATGDVVDFWRVLLADKNGYRLLLFAEMKLPGEAWLEFRIQNGVLYQTATFRPRGILGRAYWYLVYPLHGIVFKGLIKALSK